MPRRRPTPPTNRIALLAIGLALCAVQVARTQDEMPVPAALQGKLLLKILPFDRALAARSGVNVTIGIVSQKHYRLSDAARSDFETAIESAHTNAVQGVPVRCVVIGYENERQFVETLRDRAVDVLYVAPLRSVDLDGIVDACRELHVLTVTGVPGYVDEGMVIGFDLRAEKPIILFNRTAAEGAGADFQAAFLKLVQFVDRHAWYGS